MAHGDPPALGATPAEPPPLHSEAFVATWRDVVARVLRLRVEQGCVRVPGLLGGATWSYLPFLNYTDLTGEAARALAARLGTRPHHLRLLDPARADFAAGDPVTLRLDLAGGDRDAIFQKRLDGKCRNQVRKAQRSDLTVRRGRSRELIDDFHALLADTLHRHGAPLLPRALFDVLAQQVDCRFCVAYADRRPVAGLVAITDRDIVWVPWAASARSALAACPNHLTYWTTIEEAIAAGKRVFDFGRSPYGGNTHRFKLQWGAQPVGLRVIASHPADVYARYQLAQRVWQSLPRALVDRLGPRLCRHLPDY